MNSKKLITLVTVACFLFSSILAPGVQAAIEAKKDAAEYRQPLDRFALPPTAGRITGGDYFGGSRVVVNIQDLHCHPEVQRNIARILASLDERYALKSVYIEGASGSVDTSWLCGLTDRDLKKEVLETLLEQGRLTGAEYYSITHNRPGLLKGIEDEVPYRENVLRLGEILEKKDQFAKKAGELRKDLVTMQARYFTARNKRLNRLFLQHKSGKISTEKYYALLFKYVRRINAHAGASRPLTTIAPGDYPNMAGYLELAEMGKHFNYQRIGRQLQEFVALLKQKLPYSVYNLLLQKTGNFSKLDELYLYLSRIAKEHKLDLSTPYPDLRDFFAYIEKGQHINPLSLVKEEKRLTEEIRIGLSGDVSELEVSFLSDFFAYLEDYLDTRLSAEDYAYFTARFGQFKALWGRYALRNRLPELEPDLKLLDEFYRVNVARNKTFLKHILSGDPASEFSFPASSGPVPGGLAPLLAALNDHPAPEIVAVVTGGFHTDGLKQLLAERKISYCEITPNVTQDTGKSSALYQQLARHQARILAAEGQRPAEAGATAVTTSRPPFVSPLGAASLALRVLFSLTPETARYEAVRDLVRKRLAAIPGKGSLSARFKDLEKLGVGVTAAGDTVALTVGARTLTVRETNGALALQEEDGGTVPPSVVVAKEVSPFTDAFVQGIAAALATARAPFEAVNLPGMPARVYEALKLFSVIAAENGWIVGDGPGFDLAHYLAQRAENTRNLDGVRIETLEQFAELVQNVILERQQRTDALERRLSENDLLRIAHTVPFIWDFIIEVSGGKKGGIKESGGTEGDARPFRGETPDAPGPRRVLPGEIAPAQIADAQAIARLQSLIYENSEPFTDEVEETIREGQERMYDELTGSFEMKTARYWVYKNNDREVAGYLRVLIDRHALGTVRKIYVSEIAVDPGARNQSIASSLWEYMEDEVRKEFPNGTLYYYGETWSEHAKRIAEGRGYAVKRKPRGGDARHYEFSKTVRAKGDAALLSMSFLPVSPWEISKIVTGGINGILGLFGRRWPEQGLFVFGTATEQITALRDYLSDRKGVEENNRYVVDLSIWEEPWTNTDSFVGDLLSAIKGGKIIEFDAKNLADPRNVEGSFNAVAANVNNFVEALYKLNVLDEETAFVARELVKNAFVHGNKADFSLPIFLKWDINEMRIEVYDMASQKQYGAEEQTLLRKKKTPNLSGYREGISSIREKGWFYYRAFVKDPVSQRLIGNAATAILTEGPPAARGKGVLLPQRWREWVRAKVPKGPGIVAAYENLIAPLWEEPLFTGVALTVGLLSGGALGGFAALLASRAAFVLLHNFIGPPEGRRPLSPREKFAVPAIISGLSILSYGLILLAAGLVSAMAGTSFSELLGNNLWLISGNVTGLAAFAHMLANVKAGQYNAVHPGTYYQKGTLRPVRDERKTGRLTSEIPISPLSLKTYFLESGALQLYEAILKSYGQAHEASAPIPVFIKGGEEVVHLLPRYTIEGYFWAVKSEAVLFKLGEHFGVPRILPLQAGETRVDLDWYLGNPRNATMHAEQTIGEGEKQVTARTRWQVNEASAHHRFVVWAVRYADLDTLKKIEESLSPQPGEVPVKSIEAELRKRHGFQQAAEIFENILSFLGTATFGGGTLTKSAGVGDDQIPFFVRRQAGQTYWTIRAEDAGKLQRAMLIPAVQPGEIALTPAGLEEVMNGASAAEIAEGVEIKFRNPRASKFPRSVSVGEGDRRFAVFTRKAGGNTVWAVRKENLSSLVGDVRIPEIQPGEEEVIQGLADHLGLKSGNEIERTVIHRFGAPGEIKILTDKVISGHGRQTTISVRKIGSRHVWVVREKQDIETLARAMGILLQFKEGEITVSKTGLGKTEIKGWKARTKIIENIIGKIEEACGDPLRAERYSIKTLGEGENSFNLFLRKDGTRIYWTIDSRDWHKLMVYCQDILDKDVLSEPKEGEITISQHADTGLKGRIAPTLIPYIVSRIEEECGLPKSAERHSVKTLGEGENRFDLFLRKQSSYVHWTIRSEDLPKLQVYFQDVLTRGVLVQYKEGEIPLSKTGLGKTEIKEWKDRAGIIDGIIEKIEKEFGRPRLAERHSVKTLGEGENSFQLFLRKDGAHIFWTIDSRDWRKFLLYCRDIIPETQPRAPVPERAQVTEEEAGRMVREELARLLDADVLALSARYSVEIKNILWGILGARLGGAYDPQKLGEIIDKQLVAIINEGTKRGREVQTLAAAKAAPHVADPVMFAPDVQTPEAISRLAERIDEQLNEQIIDEGLRSLVGNQARYFIRKLEETYFFKAYYRSAPGRQIGEECAEAVRALLGEEKIPLVRQALGAMLDDIERAIRLQAELHERGLRATTNLNLYQLIAVQRMGASKKVLLADQMGLGKTLETLAAFLVADAGEMLVVAPKAALPRWMDDIAKHLDTELELVLLADEEVGDGLAQNARVSIRRFRNAQERNAYLLSARPKPSGKRIILANYEIIPGIERQRAASGVKASFEVDFVALDEAHLLKNRLALTSKGIFGDSEGRGGIAAEYKVVISGTPLENQAQELLSYLQYLSAGGASEEERLFASIDRRRFSQIFKTRNLASLSQLHAYLLSRMIRRLKEDVVKGLPAKKFLTVRLDPIKGTMSVNGEGPSPLPGDYLRQLDLYETALQNPREFERKFVDRTPAELEEDEKEDESLQRATQLLRLEQCAIDPGIFGETGDSIKLDAAERLAEERVRQGKSVLIFSNYRRATERLRARLEARYGAEAVAYVDGSVVDRAGSPRRSEEIARFQNKQAPVMIATVGTMGVAVELTQADAVIFLNYPWKPSTLNQAVDRAHRIDPVRNREGKELEVISLEIDLPLSIDVLKAMVLKRKSILAEMIVEGNLSPEILEAFIQSDTELIEAVKNKTDKPVELDEYELSMLEQLRVRIKEILATRSAGERDRLWNELADFYYQVIERKSSFFANMASLDFLSKSGRAAFEKLRSTDGPLKVLDLASGPSTLYRAYMRNQAEFQRSGLVLDITDYDLSPRMLQHGIQRPDRQVLGAFESLGRAFPEEQFDMVNLSYAFRLAAHPAQLVRDVHRILKDNGMLILILPRTNIFPPRFIQAFTAAGFDVPVGLNDRLQTRMDDETYRLLSAQYGKEFADDVAREVRGEFTYLVANKRRPGAGALGDDDFLVQKAVPPFNARKIKDLRASRGTFEIIPNEVTVEGRVITLDEAFPAEERESAPEPEAVVFGPRYLDLQKKIELIHRQALQYLELIKTGKQLEKERRKQFETRKDTLKNQIEQNLGDLEEHIASSRAELGEQERESLQQKLAALPGQDRAKGQEALFHSYGFKLRSLIRDLQPYEEDEGGNDPSALTMGFIYDIVRVAANLFGARLNEGWEKETVKNADGTDRRDADGAVMMRHRTLARFAEQVAAWFPVLNLIDVTMHSMQLLRGPAKEESEEQYKRRARGALGIWLATAVAGVVSLSVTGILNTLFPELTANGAIGVTLFAIYLASSLTHSRYNYSYGTGTPANSALTYSRADRGESPGNAALASLAKMLGTIVLSGVYGLFLYPESSPLSIPAITLVLILGVPTMSFMGMSAVFRYIQLSPEERKLTVRPIILNPLVLAAFVWMFAGTISGMFLGFQFPTEGHVEDLLGPIGLSGILISGIQDIFQRFAQPDETSAYPGDSYAQLRKVAGSSYFRIGVTTIAGVLMFALGLEIAQAFRWDTANNSLGTFDVLDIIAYGIGTFVIAKVLRYNERKLYNEDFRATMQYVQGMKEHIDRQGGRQREREWNKMERFIEREVARLYRVSRDRALSESYGTLLYALLDNDRRTGTYYRTFFRALAEYRRNGQTRPRPSPSAVTPRNENVIAQWTAEGKSAAEMAVRIAADELVPSVLNPYRFITSHRDKRGAALVVVAGYVAGIAALFFTLPALQPALAVVAGIAALSGANLATHTVLDWHYIRSAEPVEKERRSELAKAIRDFGTAAMVRDAGGKASVHTQVYFMDTMPRYPEAWGLRPAGVTVDGKPAWISTSEGALIVFVNGGNPEQVTGTFNRLLGGNGLLAGSGRLAARFRYLLGTTGLDLKNRGFKAGVVIDHSQTGKKRWYDENGHMVVTADYFAFEGENAAEYRSAKLGELMTIRNAEAGRMLASGIFMNFDVKDIKAFLKSLEAFRRAGNTQLIADRDQLQYPDGRKLTEAEIRAINAEARSSGMRIFAILKNKEGDQAEKEKAGYLKLGFAGYQEVAGTVIRLHDFTTSDIIEPELVSKFTSARELEQKLRANPGRAKMLNLSEFERLLRGGERSIVDRVALTELLKTALLSGFTARKIGREDVRGVAYAWERDRLPSLPEDRSALFAEVNKDGEVTAEDITRIVGLLGLGGQKSHAVKTYLEELARPELNREAPVPQLQQEFLTAIVERALTKEQLGDDYPHGLAQTDDERNYGEMALAQVRYQTRGKPPLITPKEFQEQNRVMTFEFYIRLQQEVLRLRGVVGDLEGKTEITDGQARAINAIIELIGHLGEPKILGTQERLDGLINQKSIGSILSAA